MLISAQNGREVEAKTIDVHVHNPVTEHKHDELSDDGMACVERIPGTGKVLVVAAAVLLQHIEDRILNATQADRGSRFISLRRVVQHDIQDDLNTGAVKGLDYLSEFQGLPPVRSCNAVEFASEQRRRPECSPSSS